MNAGAQCLRKEPTGIADLDAVTGGGLPAAGATLLLGEAGCGKTVLGLQILASVIERGGGGVFLSFEESSDQLVRNAHSFSWGPTLAGASRLRVIEAPRVPSTEGAGRFDLNGLIATLDAVAGEVDARWIVLDGIDQVLRLQPDPRHAVDEIVRLRDWCARTDRTVVITGKHGPGGAFQPERLEGVEFLLSTVMLLGNRIVEQRLERWFRILKYRGSAHAADELTMLIDDSGICLPYADQPDKGTAQAPDDRVSTGVEALDAILEGGMFRGSTTLISGQPGTAKTTLASAFAAAAAARGERVLFWSFDEYAAPIVRNVASVGIDLATPLASGWLRLEARAAWTTSAEAHYLAIRRAIEAFEPACLVIDPVSALHKSAGSPGTYLALERLLLLARNSGITVVITSLTEGDAPLSEATLSHTSTLADTWISLRYKVHAGERNRTLSVVKARGTAHSNQVRELVLSRDGVGLAEPYQFGTEVLLGTARFQKEREEADAVHRREQERALRQRQLEDQLGQARSRVAEAERDMEALQRELDHELRSHQQESKDRGDHRQAVLQRRRPGRRGGAGYGRPAADDNGMLEDDH